MNTQTISINSVDYLVQFGIKSNLLLGKKWKVNKFSQVAEKLSKLDFKEGEEPTMEQLLIMSQLILSGIIAAKPSAKLDEDDIFNWMLNNMNVVASLIELYANNQPQDKGEKSKNVNPDQRKK